MREWLYWEVDTLFPPIFSGYGVHLGKRGLLPIAVSPEIAEYHGRRAEAALTILDGHLAHGGFLCDSGPTIADIACCCDVVFAGMSEMDTTRWKNVTGWAARIAALPGFAPALEMLPMANAEFTDPEKRTRG